MRRAKAQRPHPLQYLVAALPALGEPMTYERKRLWLYAAAQVLDYLYSNGSREIVTEPPFPLDETPKTIYEPSVLRLVP